MRNILMILFVLTAVAQGAGELLLGAAQKTRHQIVIPDQYPDARIEGSVRQAAELMQRAFRENGIEMAVVSEGKVTAGHPGIYLGQTEFAKRNGVDFAAMEGWTFTFKAVSPNLIIAGNDRLDPIPLERRRPREASGGGLPMLGTLKGTTEFLYQYAGVRFLMPGEHGVEFLPTPVLYVADDLNVTKRTYAQDMEISKSNDIFAIANGFEPMPGVLSNYGHYHHTVINAKQDGEKHPEYFILASGRRDNRSPHLCFSNPEVRERIYQKVLEDCDTGYDIIEMGQNDGFRPCACDACAALYDLNPTSQPADGIGYLKDWVIGEKLWIMHRDMALRLLKDRPGKKLMISAYSVARNPPKTFDSLPENVIVQIMSPTPERVEAWKRMKVPGGFMVYTYTWGGGSYTPKNTLRTITTLTGTLVDNGIQAIQNNGKPIDYGIEGVNIYVYRRLLNDPGAKTAEALFEEYIEAAYREASTPMLRFFQVLQQRLEFREQAGLYAHSNRNPLLQFSTLYTPELLSELSRLLERAEQIDVSDRVKARLAKTRFEFDFVKSLSDTVMLYYAYLTRPDAVSWDRALTALEERNAWIDSAPRGKRPSYTWGDANSLKTVQVAVEPFTWDTARMRAEGYHPEGKEARRLTVPRVSQAVAIDAPFWKKLSSHPLQLPQGVSEPLQSATSFQVAYDDHNLYVRVEAELKADLMDSFHARGRDEELWLQECINLLLAPSGYSSQYYYLTYEPVANSFIDSNHGFIADSLHPKFGWNDQTWDGDWTYVNALKPVENRWVSLATIPFATLETPAPRSGTVWAANVGRVHYRETIKDSNHSAMVKNREVSVWTGKLNASFNPGEAFMGEMVFE